MEIFSSPVVRRSLFAMLGICLVLEALFAPYGMTADTVSYLDLSDLIHQHQWHWVVNAYWHPGYPALLLLARMVMRTTVWNELAAVRMLNLAITGFLFLAVRFALNSAVELRESRESGVDGLEPIRRETVGVLAAAITLVSVLRELTVREVRPDVLLAGLVFFGVGFLMRVGAKNRLSAYAGMGVCFGLGFWVKSVAFPVFLIALLLLPFAAGSMRRAAKGFAVTALIFAAVAGPYIGAISKQKGRFTAGDSGGLNYAWYVDGADRFEQQNNDPSRYGLAKANLKHPSLQIMKDPPIYFYGMAMPGTEPQWEDPSYWNDGLKPRFNLKAEASTVRAGLLIALQYFVMRSQYILLFVVLVMLGGRWRRRDFGWRGVLPVLLLAVAQIAMYVLVYTEPRYIASAALVPMIVLMAFVRIPKGSVWQGAVALCGFVFLGMSLCASLSASLQNMKRQRLSEGRAAGWYNQGTFSAGESLAKAAGIHPGDTVACFGEGACRNDIYWARLAQVHIRTEMFADMDPPLDVWEKSDHEKTLAALRSTGAKAVVADFGPNVTPPAEWKRLGTGEYFVIYL
jgi:hypothetical protein